MQVTDGEVAVVSRSATTARTGSVRRAAGGIWEIDCS